MINKSILNSNSRSKPPEILASWLNYKSSLTDKLKQAVGEASLSVLNQQWQRPTWWDRFALGLTGSKIMQRNSMIFAKGLACWFARTLIPDCCYLANEYFFNRLKQESLGTLLFNTQGLTRSALFYYHIDASHLEYYWISPAYKNSNSPLWLRLSIFCFQGKESFYLIEIFLPGLIRVLR